jgi:hypothetical protein
MDKTNEVRTAFAGLAMAAMIPLSTDHSEDRPKVIAERALEYAEALLAELAKPGSSATP